MKRILILVLVLVMCLMVTGCGEYAPTASQQDRAATIAVGDVITENQPTPTDITHSLERFNLIRRAYWVNGQREKALSLPRPMADIPLGYCILLTEGGAVVGSFVVDGKVTCLNSFLTPDSEYFEKSMGDSINVNRSNRWMPDVDGSYGENDDGIFFFTPDGRYIEWSGIYLYSDIPFHVDDPVVKVGAAHE